MANKKRARPTVTTIIVVINQPSGSPYQKVLNVANITGTILNSILVVAQLIALITR